MPSPVLGEPRAQADALDELHDEGDVIAFGRHVVHGDDVRVRDAGERLGLALELLIARAAPATQQLDRDLAIELRVVGCVHDTHASRPDAVHDDVPAERRARGHLEVGRPRGHADRVEARGVGASEVGRQPSAYGAGVEVRERGVGGRGIGSPGSKQGKGAFAQTRGAIGRPALTHRLPRA